MPEKTVLEEISFGQWLRERRRALDLTQQAFTDQAAFLAGYVAASVTKTGKVGTFGGVDFELVLDFMDGFARGVAY